MCYEQSLILIKYFIHTGANVVVVGRFFKYYLYQVQLLRNFCFTDFVKWILFISKNFNAKKKKDDIRKSFKNLKEFLSLKER